VGTSSGGGGGTPTIAAGQSAYAESDHVTVTFAGLPGNAGDWIAIAPQGSDVGTYVGYAYVNGAKSGALDFGLFAAGTYVARAFSNNTTTLIVESAPFTVGTVSGGGGGTPTLAADKASFATTDHVTVTFSGLPGNEYDWIAIAPQGSAVGTYVTYAYLYAAKSGTLDLGVLAAGTYVARAFSNNSSNLIVESAPFTVGGSSAGGGASITTDATIAAGANVIATFSGFPGNQYDWLAIAPAGAPLTTYSTYQYLAGAKSGTLNLGFLAPGTYVVRGFSDNSANLIVESASFVAQ